MSVFCAWDLQSKSSPRSLCVYRAAGYEANTSTNPFDVAATNENYQSAHSIVFGTERGFLHYRTYAPPSSERSFSRSTPPQSPLETPRHYMPVDLQNAFPGVVVSVVRGASNIFLVLVDDNRGTSHHSPGAYAAHLVTLRHGVFTPLQSTLPRMSCATFDSTCGFVYAAGKSVASFVPNNDDMHVFSHSVALPSPGARSGQDAIEVTAGGKVAVVAVGNSFYAVSQEETLKSVKLISFAQSSQVHPVIVLDVHDPSVHEGWSCLFLASGRECAIVDLHHVSAITCSPPRHGVVTMASPILAAGAVWPWVAVLTSDGLVSIRSPSCMAIPLRTVEVGTRPNDYFIMRTLPQENWMVAISYSGNGKVLQFQPDTRQVSVDIVHMMMFVLDIKIYITHFHTRVSTGHGRSTHEACH